MFSFPSENWLRLFLWLGIGLTIYAVYGRRHSLLARRLAPARERIVVAPKKEETA